MVYLLGVTLGLKYMTLGGYPEPWSYPELGFQRNRWEGGSRAGKGKNTSLIFFFYCKIGIGQAIVSCLCD